MFYVDSRQLIFSAFLSYVVEHAEGLEGKLCADVLQQRLLILSPLLCTYTGLCLFIVSVDTSLILWSRFHVEYLIITQVANKFLVSYNYLFTYSLILWHFERNAHSTLSTAFCCHLNLGLPMRLLPLFFPQVYSQIFC